MKAPDKFATDAMQFPLFIGHPARLAEKLDTAGGLLKAYCLRLRAH